MLSVVPRRVFSVRIQERERFYLVFSSFCLSVGALRGGSVLAFSRESSTGSEVRGSHAVFAAFGSSAGASSPDNRLMVVGGRKTSATKDEQPCKYV